MYNEEQKAMINKIEGLRTNLNNARAEYRYARNIVIAKEIIYNQAIDVFNSEMDKLAMDAK